MGVVVLAVAGAVTLLLLLVLLVMSRLKVASPNEAFIITGRKGRAVTSASGVVSTDLSGQKVVLGASVFVIPMVQRLHRLDLSSRRIPVGIRGAVSAQGIRCDLEGVAIVKVGGTEGAIRAAAQRFLHQQDGIEVFTSEVLAGSLRSIVGRLTVEAIIRDRAAFATAVAEEAEASLTNQGLVLDTFQLQDIQAEGSYLADLGRPEASRVLKEAAIAEARARQAAEQERLLAEEAVAVSERQLALKKAEIQAEIDAARAQSAAAGPLAQAERDQAVLAEQEKVAARNAGLKEKQLDAEVRRPADAARYRIEQEAEAARNAAVFKADAERQATIAAAQAAAEQARLIGEGERARRAALAEAEAIEGAKRGEAEKSRRLAIAQAVEAEGTAEASAVLARGRAEAEAMRVRAQSFGEYNEAAVLDMLVGVLPEVVREAAQPLAAVDKMTVISTDGASSLTRTVSSTVAQGLQLGSDLTGVDLPALLGRLGSMPAVDRSTKPADAITADDR
ncbi:flotillin [Virgisporangium aliadipatigenens]|uniref:Flotillin n=1 Tax=Virgisporangium aliadipatigenens TaxID=741659 RepID=A0A8J3YRX3_9ACTN|nr:flotillin [Virgisporangium aliadipatigenens]